MSPLLTPEFRRADESKQREAGTDGQMTLNQERELRDVVERRGWREDRAQLRDGVHDAAVAGGSVAREGYAPRGRYQRPTSEATVLHKSNGSTGFVRNASKPASLSSLLVYLSQCAVTASAGMLPPFESANRRS